MKTSRTSLQHLMAWFGIVATAVAVACSATDPKDPKDPSFRPLPRITTEPVSNGECTGRAAAPILSLQGSGDRVFKLAHIPGCGWRLLLAETTYVGRGTSALQGAAEGPVADSTLPGADPMAVFIDGPTGYTFAWSREAGWKFVGHLVDQDR